MIDGPGTAAAASAPLTRSRIVNRAVDRVIFSLRWLARRPGALFAVTWAANALKQPYGNLIHDSRLYAFQAQNQLSGGAFGHDLFLRFGSQDQYTPFSRLAAPLAAALGIDWSFFVLFLVSNALLLFALQRLIAALIDDQVVAAAALIFVALSSLTYGGIGIFQVEEPFFTPRLASCALALLALERILRSRYASGLALAVVATIVHPLMGFGAVTVGVLCTAFDVLPQRVSILMIGAAGVLGMVVLGYPPLGHAVFGTMDDEWLWIVRNASSYNFPGWWRADDWIRIAMSIGLAVYASVSMLGDRPRRARFVLVCAAVAGVGVVAMYVAGRVPYRLLLQGQPYRALWILEVLEIPLAFLVAARWWTAGGIPRTASVLLIGFFGFGGFFGLEIGFGLISCFVAILLSLPKSRSDNRDWLAPALIVGLAVAFLLTTAARMWLIGSVTADVLPMFGVRPYASLWTNAPGPLVWYAVILLGMAFCVGSGTRPKTAVAVAVGVAIVTHSVVFAVPRIPRYADKQVPYSADLAFVRAHVKPSTSGAPLTVYEGIWGDGRLVWFDLKADTYFHLVQLSGVIFNRETAIEGKRRSVVVKPFELERYHVVERFLARWDRMMSLNLWGPIMDTTPPSMADLRRLCREDEGVDVAILKHDFGGLASATNGHVYIYECARVRATKD